MNKVVIANTPDIDNLVKTLLQDRPSSLRFKNYLYEFLLFSLWCLGFSAHPRPRMLRQCPGKHHRTIRNSQFAIVDEIVN